VARTGQRGAAAKSAYARKVSVLAERDWRIRGRFATPRTVLEANTRARLDDVTLATKRGDVSRAALRPENLDRLPEVRSRRTSTAT